MAGELVGYNGKVTLGANTVASLKDWKLTIDGNELDTSAFGNDFKQVIIGMKSWSATAAGSFVISSDTNGQKAIQDALLAATPTSVALKLYVNATHYYSGTAFIKKVSVDNTAADLVKIDFEFVGSGQLSFT